MSKRNRLMLLTCIALAVFVIPAETMSIRALSSEGTLAAQWAQGLSPAQRVSAGVRSEEYPIAYRQAVIGVLSAQEMSTVFLARVDHFVASHAGLTESQRDLLERVKRLGTAAKLTRDKDAVAERHAVGLKVRADVGEDAFNYIFLLGGPTAKGNSEVLPATVRLQSWLRSKLILSAFVSCNCYSISNIDCGGDLPICSELTDCTRTTYVGCGIWYLEPCTGYCIANLPS